MTGFSNELAYPNHWKRLESEGGMLSGRERNGRTKASTKKGSQHIVKALMMMPSVVDAFRSLAS